MLFKFLSLLKQNNNRYWFNENKNLYKVAFEEFEDLVENLISKISTYDPLIANLKAKDCIYRIYRDTRFSKDKRPYKEYFCAVISVGGRKSNFAGYVLHVEPGNSFLGGGIYRPPKPIADKIRWHITENHQKFLKVIKSKNFSHTFGEIYGEKLKRIPAGFPKNFEYPELLKYKSFALKYEIDDKKVVDTDFVNLIYKQMKPFNDFLNESL